MEARRSERRRRLLDAGLQEIGTAGYDRTTVKGVCDRAGLTERYFYESFQDRAALLTAVFEDVVATVTASTARALAAAGEGAYARARAGLEGFLGALGEDPRRARVQLIEVVGRSEELERRRFEVMHEFAGYIERAAGELDPSLDFAAEPWRRAVVLALVGGTNHLAIEWTLGGLAMSAGELVDALVALYVASAAAIAPAPR